MSSLRRQGGGVESVAFSPDGKQIASASSEGIKGALSSTRALVELWDASTGSHTWTLRGHTRQVVTSLAFSPDGKRIASASNEEMVVWDTPTGKEVFTLRGHTGGISSVAFSPDGKHIASASGYEMGDNTAKVWDASTGREVLTVQGAGASVVFSPDGKQIASVWRDTLKVWDASTRQETLTLRGHTSLVSSVAFSRDGNRIASGSVDGTVEVWDATSGRETLTLKGHTGLVTSVAFSPDGKHIASASQDRTVKVWDASTGQRTLTLRGHTQGVLSVAFSPDGNHIASASEDQTVKVWDTSTGEESLTLKGHTQSVTSVAFSPDGKRIASASLDTTVRLWDASTGQETVTLRGHTLRVVSVAFSPDGNRIASGSSDVKLWDLTKLKSSTRPARAAAPPKVPKAPAPAPSPKRPEKLIGAPHVPRGKLTFVDLQPKANWKLAPDLPGGRGIDLAELPRGEQTFAGVRMRIGDSCIQLGSKNLPKAPLEVKGIQVSARVATLYILHAAQECTDRFGQKVVDGTTVAQYRVRYEDGGEQVIPVVSGQDIRDWYDVDQGKPATRASVVWTGGNPDTRRRKLSLRLYLSVWENPQPDKKVLSIDFASTNTTAAPFCVAMTVEEPVAVSGNTAPASAPAGAKAPAASPSKPQVGPALPADK
jgi:WD40 repeat protein